ncbi:MAG: hypothetical protein ACLP7Q_12560 [Isosphaeraceae bacterium]
MAKELATNELHGRIGESRTEELLLQRFWVMKRIPDVDGADYLVQRAATSLSELRARQQRIEVLGIVQSKFVQGAHEVVIPVDYVMDQKGVRTEFFLFIHSDGVRLEPELYFFTARQIIEEKEFFKRANAKGKDEFIFSRAAGRTYQAYRNLPRKDILDAIEAGIESTEQTSNDEFVTQILSATVSPGSLDRVSWAYVPEPGEEARFSHQGNEYLLQQQGSMIKVTKYSNLTATTTVVGEFHGRLGSVAFDPHAETISALPGS